MCICQSISRKVLTNDIGFGRFTIFKIIRSEQDILFISDSYDVRVSRCILCLLVSYICWCLIHNIFYTTCQNLCFIIGCILYGCILYAQKYSSLCHFVKKFIIYKFAVMSTWWAVWHLYYVIWAKIHFDYASVNKHFIKSNLWTPAFCNHFLEAKTSGKWCLFQNVVAFEYLSC